MMINKEETFSGLVNFKKNLSLPKHKWFNIKEGYSSELVQIYIDNLNIKDGYIVDFFSGSGTTALSAKKNKLKYFCIEVNPFLHSLSLVKLEDYNDAELKKIINLKQELFINKKSLKDYSLNLSIAKKVFDFNYKTLILLRNNILNINDKKIQQFFIIVLCSILEEIGIAKKDGNGLKYPKNKTPLDIKLSFDRKFDEMISDIKNESFLNIKGSKILCTDSRNLSEKNLLPIKDKTSLVIFSPPYANCFDYSEVYKLELWVGNFIKEYSDLKILRNKSLSSHLNKNLLLNVDFDLITDKIDDLKQKKLWSTKIIPMLNNYFYEMQNIILMSYNILKKDGSCVIVVANSAYSGIIIETDKIFCDISEKIGFTKTSIKVARKIRASSQQSKILSNNGHNLRESIIELKK